MPESRRIMEEIGGKRPLGYALSGLGSVADQTGELEEAARLHQEALDVWAALPYPSGLVSARISRGEIKAKRGLPGEARTDYEEALAKARELGLHGPVVRASCLLALLPGGDGALVQEEFEEHEAGLSYHEKIEARYHLFQITGDRTHFDGARKMLDHFRDQIPEEYRDSTIEHVPLHRDIMAG